MLKWKARSRAIRRRKHGGAVGILCQMPIG
jgi:hypothetical protein